MDCSDKNENSWRDAVPFGLSHTKPRHFRDMIKVAWENRDNLCYGWKVLSQGVCDGCALGVAGFHDWTIEGVHLCMTRLNLLRLNTMPAFDPAVFMEVEKLEGKSNRELREMGRLGYPMLRSAGDRGFHRISWEEAFSMVGPEVRKISPERMAFFVTSRGVTNEVYYMAQKVARFLGTNNIDNAARLCHSPSTGAMKHALGVSASTCSYSDWFGTDLIVFFGSNPANDQPVATKYLHEAKKLGTRVAMVNPYREPGMEKYWVPSSAQSALLGTKITDYWFPVTQGGDISFLYGALKWLIENNGINHEFVDQYTVGFEKIKDKCRQLDWETIEQGAGVSRSVIEAFGALIQKSPRAVFVWSMGITQHSYGGDAVSMILNLGLSRGYVGLEKCGLMPIRGHSSVQGGAEMGANCSVFPGGVPIHPESAATLSEEYGFCVPDKVGLNTVEMVDAAGEGKLDLLYCVGGNFLRTLPQPDQVRKALERIPLRIHQDILITDQMLVPSKGKVLLLPAKTRYEQDEGGTETTTERRIIFSPEIPREVGEARAEWRILEQFADAVWPERKQQIHVSDGWELRKEIARIVPFYAGIEHLRKTGDAIQYGGRDLCANRIFPTRDGKAHFKTVEAPGARAVYSDDPKTRNQEEVFMVSTRRGKQFNTLIFADKDPLTGASREAIFMSEMDALRLGFSDGDRATLRNDIGSFSGRIFVSQIAPGNLQIHWPEGNVIIPRKQVDAIGGVPDYNALVTVEREIK
ncbi:MAG: formate dehydrogenase [Verrucomicrobiales bacterium]|nr:formate dehydrogenase [Verrucomicrobiales bacterium]